MTEEFKIIDVNIDNVEEYGIFCSKDKKSDAYLKKLKWFKKECENGLRFKIAFDQQGKQMGFIEYLPSEKAWRPIAAKKYYFIQCIMVFSKAIRNQNLGSDLISLCEKEAKKEKLDGICTMTSKGSWIANNSIFKKNKFEKVDESGRFELYSKKIKKSADEPKFYDWEKGLPKYKGWHLIYSDQCPWHDKAVKELSAIAEQNKFKLQIKKLKSAEEAQKSVSGFGTFALVKDGVLLEDHYISATRFKSIIKKTG